MKKIQLIRQRAERLHQLRSISARAETWFEGEDLRIIAKNGTIRRVRT